MASKRIKDADSVTLSLTHKIAFDKTGLSEFKQGTLAELITFLDSKDIFTTTFVVGDTNGTPDWDINFSHGLNTAFADAVFWDGSGNQISGNGIASIVDVDNVKGRMHHAISGTWKTKITKS